MLDQRSELLFWTGIMRDHAIFQVNALAPKEAVYIQNSMYYMNFFQQMYSMLERTNDIEALYQNLYNGLICFIEYKKALLKGLLACHLQMNLPPSLINHMINEAMEFKAVLEVPCSCAIDTPVELASYLKIWLTDSVGHAAGLASLLDPAEGLLISEIKSYKEAFDKLLDKASELEMMLPRTGLCDGAFALLADETVEWLEKFNCFLEKVKKLRMCCSIMAQGTLSPLLPDHLIREHKYYIDKIKFYIK